MKPRIAGANDDRETSTDNMWDYNKGRWITYYNTGDAVDAQMTISSRIHDRMRYQLHNLTMEERHWRLSGPRDGNWSPNRTLNGFQYDQYFKEIITERSPPHGVSHRKPTKWFRVCQEKLERWVQEMESIPEDTYTAKALKNTYTHPMWRVQYGRNHLPHTTYNLLKVIRTSYVAPPREAINEVQIEPSDLPSTTRYVERRYTDVDEGFGGSNANRYFDLLSEKTFAHRTMTVSNYSNQDLCLTNHQSGL